MAELLRPVAYLLRLVAHLRVPHAAPVLRHLLPARPRLLPEAVVPLAQRVLLVELLRAGLHAVVRPQVSRLFRVLLLPVPRLAVAVELLQPSS